MFWRAGYSLLRAVNFFQFLFIKTRIRIRIKWAWIRNPDAELQMICMTLPRWATLVGLPQEKDGGDDGPGSGDVGGEPRPRHQQQAAQHQEEVKHLVAHTLYYLLRAFRHFFTGNFFDLQINK